jgi:two-component system, cell cycle sensor histidine kinase and response regulator CckA
MAAAPVILVVEDDADVRAMIAEALATYGMTVIEAASGHEALRILQRDRTISILLSDVMMPGISGLVLAERAAQLRPDVKTLLLSAYPPAVTTRPVLTKPLRVAQLCAEIDRVVRQ